MPELCSSFDDELLERYALGRLSEPECASLEEHLLLCTSCQVRLDQTDEYVAAVRGAFATLPRARQASAKALRSARFLRTLVTSRPVQLYLGAAIVAVSLFVAIVYDGGISDISHATLVSVRSGDGIAHAKPARRLVLDLDAALLPERPGYLLQVVDHSGREIWSGDVAIDAPVFRVTLDRRFSPGRYWLRLYGKPATADDILREYGLDID